MTRIIKLHKQIHKKILLWGFFTILLLGTLAFSSVLGRKASAQGTDNTWSTPTNLSHSGASTSPLMVVDSDGIVHVIWEDQFDGWVYTYQDGDKWSSPEPVSFPFAYSTPRLFSDSQGFIHAIWMSNDNTLVYSRVSAKNFGQAGSWEAQQTLASSAVDFDLSEDGQGNLHLAYVRVQDDGGFPAGIYYRNSKDTGTSWSQAIGLYNSAYFRELTPDNANVKITSGGSGANTQVFVAWDNRSRKQVFLAQSNDGGESWNDPLEIDQPDSTSGIGSPFDIRVSVEGNDVLLIWQNGQPGAVCTQYYQSSSDMGANWGQRHQMLDELSNCPGENEFFHLESGLTLLQTIVQNQVYLTVWDGTKWSVPQLQQSLSGFVDPETFDPVIYGCYQSGLVKPDQLFVVGCDTGGGGDIWATDRVLGNTADWFPPPPVWSNHTTIVSSGDEIVSPVLVAGSGERLHCLWIQKDETAANVPGKVIYYSGWDGEKWSTPKVVLRSPNGDVIKFSAITDALGRLLIVWNDNKSGEIFFSWAKEEKASISQEWSPPETLSASYFTLGSQDIAIDKVGTIYVVFAIPLNENRGIYIIQSKDNGQTWSQPIQVFDGVSAGWQTVDNPHLTISGDGILHLLWSRSYLPSGGGSQGLYYSQSEDSGMTWLKADEVTEASVDWGRIIDINGIGLQRLWQENQTGQSILKYQSSTDQGSSWSSQETFPSFSQNVGQTLVSLTQDIAGKPHLMREFVDSLSNRVVWYWTFGKSGWEADENRIELDKDKIASVKNLSSAVSASGQLGVLFSGSITPEPNNEPLESVIFTRRSIDVPEVLPTQPKLTPLPTSSSVPTVLSTSEPPLTPTIDVINFNKTQSDDTSGNSNEVGFLLGAGLSGLIVTITLAWKVFQIRSGRK